MLFKSDFLYFGNTTMQTEILPQALSGKIQLLGLQDSEYSNTTSSLQPRLIECGVSQSRRLSHGNTVPKA